MSPPNSLSSLLKSVSRSFYLSLRILPAGVRPATGVGYLLCKTADTIADTAVFPFEERIGLLQLFDEAFRSFPLSPEKTTHFSNQLCEKIPSPQTTDDHLLVSLEKTIQAFTSLSKADQAHVQKVLRAVIRGMMLDLDLFGGSADSLKALPTEDDLEMYLKDIGGEPGRFWTNICLDHFPSLRIIDRGKWIEDGIVFGTGLQMINILRDIPQDLKNGRCYIPSTRLESHGLTPQNLLTDQGDVNDRFLPLYHALINETTERLRHGLDYMGQLPRTAWRLRAAVWWPLVMGLLTLEKLRTSYFILNTTAVKKITRGQVYFSLLKSLFILPFDTRLRRNFEEFRERLLP